eukprot:m.255373 g.255373  ORF g.255373 m.255373 type:complete len:141 (-) comp11011_c0_seq20:332-754(-)
MAHYCSLSSRCMRTFWTSSATSTLENHLVHPWVGTNSCFAVWFSRFSRFSLQLLFHPSLLGMHAMVIVGFKRPENGKLLFLVQNWWAQKQFVVMDENYLQACGGSLAAIETPQRNVPDEMPTVTGRIVETEILLDMRETT